MLHSFDLTTQINSNRVGYRVDGGVTGADPLGLKHLPKRQLTKSHSLTCIMVIAILESIINICHSNILLDL